MSILLKPDKDTKEGTISLTVSDVLIGKKAHEILSSGKSGTICGIYSTACYCTYKNGDVLMLYDRSFGRVPFGIGLPDITSVLRTSGLTPGMRLLCGKQRLSSPDLNWSLAYNEKKKREDIKHPKNFKLISSEALNQRLRQTANILLHGKQGIVKELFTVVVLHSTKSPMNTYCRAAEQPLCNFLTGCSSGDSNDICSALKGLIGLGPGLTPSLDDLLTGFTYTYSALMPQDCKASFKTTLKVLKNLIPLSAKNNTSTISSTYLSAAVDGTGFSVIDDVLHSLLYGTDIKTSVNSLLRIGSNSGADILTGILIGIYFLTHFYEEYIVWE